MTNQLHRLSRTIVVAFVLLVAALVSVSCDILPPIPPDFTEIPDNFFEELDVTRDEAKDTVAKALNTTEGIAAETLIALHRAITTLDDNSDEWRHTLGVLQDSLTEDAAENNKKRCGEHVRIFHTLVRSGGSLYEPLCRSTSQG